MQRQGFGMQHQERERLRIRIVDRVAKDRVAQFQHMDPQLMTSAGFW